MILVGQYDSPFVRCVAVTLNLYSLPFGRRPFSVFKGFGAVLDSNVPHAEALTRPRHP